MQGRRGSLPRPRAPRQHPRLQRHPCNPRPALCRPQPSTSWPSWRGKGGGWPPTPGGGTGARSPAPRGQTPSPTTHLLGDLGQVAARAGPCSFVCKMGCCSLSPPPCGAIRTGEVFSNCVSSVDVTGGTTSVVIGAGGYECREQGDGALYLSPPSPQNPCQTATVRPAEQKSKLRSRQSPQAGHTWGAWSWPTCETPRWAAGRRGAEGFVTEAAPREPIPASMSPQRPAALRPPLRGGE